MRFQGCSWELRDAIEKLLRDLDWSGGAGIGVGAVVGAATAKKTTKVVEEGRTTSSTYHKYQIALNVDDISNPVRVIDFRYNEEKAEQVANVLKIILHRNQDNVLND